MAITKVTFSFTPDDLQSMDQILDEMLRSGIRTNKSEIVRAGLQAIQSLPLDERKSFFDRIEKLAVGRKKSPVLPAPKTTRKRQS